MSGPSGWYDDFDVLPDITVDETAVGWVEDAAAPSGPWGSAGSSGPSGPSGPFADADDERLAWERPPHWSD